MQNDDDPSFQDDEGYDESEIPTEEDPEAYAIDTASIKPKN